MRLVWREEGSIVSENRLLKIRLSLRGRPIRSYTFSQDCVVVGRDPEADIELDNPGISRTHLRIERTAEGYVAVDQDSANGTFLNDQLIRRQVLKNEDVLRVGKFSLWLTLEEDRRGGGHDASAAVAPTGATTVLTLTELDRMLRVTRAAEPAPPGPAAPSAPEPRPRRSLVSTPVGLLVAFMAGTAVGIGAMWYMSR
jgi:predicted component of type VI protein secretion system